MGIEKKLKMASLKFAAIPTKYAPKRKLIDFALPKWRQKLGEFNHPDLIQWANSLYQSKVFKTSKEFNEAYDVGIKDILYWRNKPMVITPEDVEAFASEHAEGAFEDAAKPGVVDKLLSKMRANLETGEKTLLIY
jgi:hypothetical protein